MLRYVFAVMVLIFTESISRGLEVGDSVLRTPITFGEAEIKFADFHGNSNLIIVGDAAEHAEILAELEQEAAAFESKYNAAVLRLPEEGEILIIDKSGYVRWKLAKGEDAAPLTIKQFEAELANLKRDEPLPIGSPAPDFRLVDVDSGLLFKLSKYRGKSMCWRRCCCKPTDRVVRGSRRRLRQNANHLMRSMKPLLLLLSPNRSLLSLASRIG